MYLLIRGHQVMLDQDLARMYEVELRTLTRAVQRNPERFPEDSMFRLTEEEFATLKSKVKTSSSRSGRRKPPLVFTELGATTLSTVLQSKRAVLISIAIIRSPASEVIHEFIGSN